MLFDNNKCQRTETNARIKFSIVFEVQYKYAHKKKKNPSQPYYLPIRVFGQIRIFLFLYVRAFVPHPTKYCTQQKRAAVDYHRDVFIIVIRRKRLIVVNHKNFAPYNLIIILLVRLAYDVIVFGIWRGILDFRHYLSLRS